ncbi:DNA polymerase III subunit beta [Allobacillus sp. GCM10007491]|uniref:Beta sliding clamp n=1 Tax=Allobacillus saliphilus TaxID=2912308 RepID=A0A941CV10_9BACI|nr:DNA polymerase III subunit beta [Allobacillus saliphilus]MBR7554477.1 DNA polymerase III subunit beta [Allobacillus saliphilus]
MKLIIERNQLMNSIQHVMKAISSRPTIAILSGIKLEAQQDYVKLTGSDSDITIESTIPREEDGMINIHDVQPGTVILQAKFVSEIVRKLPGDQVEIESDDELNVTIRSGAAEFKLNGQDAEEYPQPALLTTDNQFEIQADVFKNLIRQTNFAVSTQETRPILTGVHFILENSVFELVATDSHRLASRKINLNGDAENISFRNIVVPGKSLSELNKILDDHQEKVYVSVSDNQILFKTANVNFLSRLLDGNYPETSRLIPEQSKTTVSIKSRELMQTIDRASLLAQDNRNNIVKLATMPNQLQITSHSPEIGTAEEKVETMSIEGEDLKISFNAKYMIDALRAIDSEEIEIAFTGAMRPFILRPQNEEESILQLITPVRTY